MAVIDDSVQPSLTPEDETALKDILGYLNFSSGARRKLSVIPVLFSPTINIGAATVGKTRLHHPPVRPRFSPPAAHDRTLAGRGCSSVVEQ